MRFRKKAAEARLDAELRYHFERLVRDFIAAGVEPAEARRRARLEFGGVEQIKEECRDVRGRWLEDFGRDLRYAARTLRRSPAFLTVSVLSLALGIGANTAIFSLINAVMLRPLPVKEPERLVETTRVGPDGKPLAVSYPLFQYFRDNLKSISGAAAEMESSPVIVMDGAEELVNAELVSGAHYSVLGISPAAGRLLEPADDVLSPAYPAAVISYRFWQRRFGLNPAAIGKTFTLVIQNKIFTIVGVTPPQYHGTHLGSDPDITLPLTMMLSDEDRHGETNNHFDMLARLAPGFTIAQANAEVHTLWQSFAKRVAAGLPVKDRPLILSQRSGALSAAHGFSWIRDDYSEALLVLMGMVALVLLLACANLSGLLLARAAAREREISIRLAIGAGSGRLMRQFLTESFLLAAVGGGAGLLLAHWVTGVLVTMMTSGETLLLSTAPDWRVLGFTGAISLAACVLAGLAPGLHALRANLNPGLRQARTGGHQRAGKALVIAQLSISMVLVVGAALFADTLAKLYRVDRGVRTDGVLVFRLRTSERYAPERRWAAIGPLLARLNALPGVASASAVDVMPISGSLWIRDVQVEGYTFRSDEDEGAAFNAIAPKYFATVGTPLMSGREFDERDTDTSNKVAIVNESFSRYFFGARPPLGRRVTARNVTYEIVGVVKDAKYQNLREDEALKTMYIPWTQREGEPPNAFNFLARVKAGDPMRLAPTLEKLTREVDPGLWLRTVQPYSAIIDRSLATERIMAALGSFFGLLALLVACLGIFGAMAFQVSRRTNEIGLRMALGASRGGIVALVLGEVAVMLAAGCLLGGAAALALTGLTRAMLFGVTPTEPAVFVVAAVILGTAALAAGWLPARRASRVDPMAALRHE
ncbi:MAG TPA: ABC transporter permease [Bryobacteraceae bacterium]|nr:ABC transporter permease [Bryobacteraceae bacterium]